MLRAFVLLAIFAFVAACSRSYTEGQPQSSAKLEETPTPLPSGPQPFNEKDLVRLDERFPKESREILEAADRIDVFEFNGCGLETFTPPKLTRIQKSTFQGCTLVRQVKVTDQNLRKELVARTLYAIGSSGNGNACFGPRHGIRAERGSMRVELVICFECENFRGVSTNGTFHGGLYAVGYEEFLEKILS